MAYHDNEIPRDGQIIRCNKERKRADTIGTVPRGSLGWQFPMPKLFFSKKYTEAIYRDCYGLKFPKC